MQEYSRIRDSNLLDGLFAVINRASDEVTLENFHFTQNDLEIIFTNITAKRLNLAKTSFKISDTVDFTCKSSNLEFLDLNRCGIKNRNNWKNSIETLETLLNGLFDSKISESLRTIDISNCGIKVPKLNEMLNQLRLNHLDITRDHQ
mmetsp:Transcript_4984/g.4763  ORF Transcript_4984/g.4763 Transcript_4984/m.4763 type:complete len:147 (+) Transcript_4984:895-1335(+)